MYSLNYKQSITDSLFQNDWEPPGKITSGQQPRCHTFRSTHSYRSRKQGPPKCQRGPSLGKPGCKHDFCLYYLTIRFVFMLTQPYPSALDNLEGQNGFVSENYLL